MTDLKSIGDKIAGVAPILAAALGGPAAGVAAELAVKALGLSSPDELPMVSPTKLSQAENTIAVELRQAELDAATKIALAQIGVNKTAAKSKSLFVAGARPAIIWVGAFGIGYHFIAAPIFNGIVAVLGGPAEAFPDIDIAPLAALVVTLLGGSALRSYEKKHGVAREEL